MEARGSGGVQEYHCEQQASNLGPGLPETPTMFSRLAASRRDILAVSIIYFVEGILDMASLANSYFLKDSLLLSPGMAGLALTVGQIPWEATPLLGLLTDAVPFCGYHRKAYLLFSGILGSLCWCLLALLCTTSIVPDLGGSPRTITQHQWGNLTGTGLDTAIAWMAHQQPQQQQDHLHSNPGLPSRQLNSSASTLFLGRHAQSQPCPVIENLAQHPSASLQGALHISILPPSSSPSHRASRRLLSTLSVLFSPILVQPPTLHSAACNPVSDCISKDRMVLSDDSLQYLTTVGGQGGARDASGAGRMPDGLKLPWWRLWLPTSMAVGLQLRCGLAVLAIFVSSACTAWTQVIADAVVVKLSQGQDQATASLYQVSSWVTYTSGAALSAYTTGAILTASGPRNVFLLAAAGLLLDGLCALLIKETPVRRHTRERKQPSQGRERDLREFPRQIQSQSLPQTQSQFSAAFSSSPFADRSSARDPNDQFEAVDSNPMVPLLGCERLLAAHSLGNLRRRFSNSNSSAMPQGSVETEARPAMRGILRLVWDTVRGPRIFGPALFVFLWQACPSPTTAMFYFQTEVLNFSPGFQEVVWLSGSLAAFSGVLLYQTFLVNKPIKKLLLWCALLGTALNATQLLLVSRLNVVIGLSDKLFVLGDYAMLSTLGEVMMTPMLALSARVCPEGAEATLYATFYSILNLSTALSTGLGSALTSLFGVTSSNFSNMTWLVLVCNVSMLLPLPLLLTLSGSDMDLGRETRTRTVTGTVNSRDYSCAASPRLHVLVQGEQVPLLEASMSLAHVWDAAADRQSDEPDEATGHGFGSLIETSYVGQLGRGRDPEVAADGDPIRSETALFESLWATAAEPANDRPPLLQGRRSSSLGRRVLPHGMEYNLTGEEVASPFENRGFALNQGSAPVHYHHDSSTSFSPDPRHMPKHSCTPRRLFGGDALLAGDVTAAYLDLEGETVEETGQIYRQKTARSNSSQREGSEEDSWMRARLQTPNSSYDESPPVAAAPAAMLQLVIRSSSLAGMASVGGVGGAGVGVSPFARLARLMSSQQSVVSLPVAAALWVAQEEAVAADMRVFERLNERAASASAAMERWCTSQSVLGGDVAGVGGRAGVGMGRSHSACGFRPNQVVVSLREARSAIPAVAMLFERGGFTHSHSTAELG